MNEDLEVLRGLIQKLPFWIVLPLTIFLYYGSVLIYIVFLPLGFVYRTLLLTSVWIEWEKQQKKALLIYSDSDHSLKWMKRLAPLLGDGAVVLNWSERGTWDRGSLPA